MNSWKKSLFGGRAGVGSGPGDTGPWAGQGAGCLRAGLSQQTGGIVESGERRVETKKKRQDLLCLPHGLAELLGESFYNCKSRSTSQLLLVY